MAEALAIAGAGWVASPIITRLLNVVFSSLGIGIKAKLQDLETTILPQFQLVIQAAEKSTEHNDELRLWLRKFKDAVYEAEDVLDEYKYQLLEEEVSDLNNPARNPFEDCIPAGTIFSRLHSCWHNLFGDCIPAGTIFSSLHSFWHNLFGGLNPFTICYRQNVMLRRSLNKLEVIAAEAQTFGIFLQIPIPNAGQNLRNEGQPDVNTSSPPRKVLGRDKERDEIIDKYLLDSSEASEPRKSYSVVAIVGMGGAGKTTLAQLVYNDPRVAAHFDVKMWVCVSRTLDVFRHTRDMIESASKDGRTHLQNPDALQGELKDLIKSKKLLLILDDVWYDNSKDEGKWETLLAPLANAGKRGSKILVTTRTMNLPEAFRPRNSMMLKDLEKNIIVSLFMHHAFFDANLNNSELQKDLENIGLQIVQKLHGSPLAAKAVGRQLRKNLKVEAWKAALQQDNLRDSQQALLWSYQRLDAQLQRCFSYFSLFSKGHKYGAKGMVHLWIAEGFINSSNDSKRMEDIGMEYFDELVSGSFLQHDENNAEYYMHDLFHDLAENVSKEDCFRIEDGDQEKEIPPTIRRLSIRGYQVEVNNISFNKLENLRTLMIEAGSLSSHATANLLTATEKCNKKLRVFMIEDFVSRRTLTKLMANLKHLRFLSFQLEEGEIPAAVGKLYHLQVLSTPYSYNVSLPRSAKNLINLRLCFTGVPISLPDIGRLTSLQTLPRFVVKKEKGHDIGQLNNLNELRESLRISNLKNVEGKDRAVEANLKDKRYLESLLLKWEKDDDDYDYDVYDVYDDYYDDYYDDDDEYKRDLDMEVLEGLQPHPNLTKLTIEGYKSHMYPSNWLPVRDLRSLKLHKCTALEVLPPICNLFPHCSELKIFGLSKLRRFASLPQHLKKLVIVNCPSLIFISEEEVQKKSIMTVMQSYQLINRELKAEEVARDCLEVKRLLESEMVDVPEDFMTTLQSCEERVDDLDLQKAYYRCQELRLEAIFGRREKSELILPSSLQTLCLWNCNITDRAFSQSLQGLTSLKSLELYNISALTTLPAEEVLHHLIALTKLKIHGCHWLKSLGGLYALPSLEKLEIETCASLELEMVMPLQGERGGSCVLPPSLREVYIKECTTMKSIVLVAGDGNPPNLATLCVDECPSLESLSLSHQTALTSLTIWDCRGLSSLLLNCLESLEGVHLQSCRSISSLPEHLPQSLRILELCNCPSISSLPEHLPQSLEFISISGCQILEERCRSPNGEDWPKIAHIPYRFIHFR